MTAERWRQIEAVLQAALDFESGAERTNFLTEVCAGDDELRIAVEELILADDAADSFIESPAWTDGGILASAVKKDLHGSFDEKLQKVGDAGDLIGRKIGVFELTKELGRGGMGAVYLAERADGEFRQQVAVKLIKRGMDTDFIVRRFRHERQILAALEHPNIARLIDGGTSDDNLPYFVMEFVDGEPLYKFCDARQLEINARLRLFQGICAAVEAAHQIKVVHRDLKPSNILVKADGKPKLLDFGIAKILDPDLAVATLEPTATAMRLMTPEYASPEQVCGETVTPASDVYSLGVLLYELLTGHRPYQFRNRALHEIHRAVCEEMPFAPSESLTREDNLLPTGQTEKTTDETTTLEMIYSARGTDFENLRQTLAGDLDKIILKALRKNAAERYQTAAEFADDIARFLEKRPVAAESFAPPLKFENAAQILVSEKHSVAILPFKVFAAPSANDTGSDEFLGVGLADALITRLSSVGRLLVRPTSSVLPFEGTTDPFAVGKYLTVKFVVDGNIRRVGERIRVSIQLLSVDENSTVWAQTFDENSADVLELEDLISEKIAASLISQLTGDERERISKRGTNNAAAYEAYLRGRFHWNQFTPDSLPKALKSFERAIELDENYAPAYVGLADFYIWANIYGLMPTIEAGDKARAAAERAVAIDDKLPEAHSTFGLTLQNRMDWTRAENAYLRAIELNPNYAQAHEWYAALLIGRGKTAAGIAEIERTEKLDPLNLRTKTLVAWTLSQAGEFASALERARQIVDLDKNYPQGQMQIGIALCGLKRVDEALIHIQKFNALVPDSALGLYPLCYALAELNRQPEAREVLEKIKKLAAETHVKPYFLGMAHAAVGESDAAFEYFEQAQREHEPWMLWFGTDAMLENLRGDNRYRRLLEKMNNPVAAKFKNRLATSSQPRTFAVLPFKLLQFNTGENSEDQFLTVGLTDALVTRFSKIRSLIVRPTNAVLRFQETDDAFRAGLELEADFVLAGNIRRAAERVRVTAQLLNVAEKSIAWAEIFDEQNADVLELEDSIAGRVAASLAPQLSGAEQKQLQKRETNNPEAYETFLRGRFYFYLMTEENFSKALGCYERAVQLDPNYALAHAAIAEYYIFLAVHCVIPFAEASRRAKAAAEKAAALDPLLAEAQNALGMVAVNHDFDWITAEKHVKHALELNPNSFAVNQWAKTLCLQTGRFDLAFEFAEKLFEIAPDSMMAIHFAAWTQHCSRRFDEAVESHRRLIKIESNYAYARMSFSWTLRCVGEFAEAVEQARRGVELAPENPMYRAALAAALADHQQIAEARAALADVEQTAATQYVSPYMLALVYCALRERERAFAELERAFQIRDVWIVFLGVEPLFDFLRADERFGDLLRRMNHPLAPQLSTT